MASASWHDFRDNGTTNLPEPFVAVGVWKRLSHSSSCVVLGREWNSSTVRKRCSCAFKLLYSNAKHEVTAPTIGCPGCWMLPARICLNSVSPIASVSTWTKQMKECFCSKQQMCLFKTGKPWICIKQISRPFHESRSMYRAGTFSVILGKIQHFIFIIRI